MNNFEVHYESGFEETIKDIIKLLISETKVSELVDNYIRFLEDEESSKLVKNYRKRLEYKQADAEAEAVAFHFFRTKVDRVQVKEIPDIGGVDFQCQIGTSKFIAEITHLDIESVTRKSGLEDELSENGSAKCYSKITEKLYNTVSRKAPQMKGYEYPGILVIACKHSHAGSLLGTSDAKCLLIGDTKIGYSVSKEAGGINSTDHVTELENSCFLQLNPDWDTCHDSISAILLCEISGASAFFVGILHPNPRHNFSYELLPSTPFVRLKKWPPEGGRIETEWVKYDKTEIVIPIPEPESLWYDSRLAEKPED